MLVPGTMVFSGKELASCAPAQLGKTEDQVVIRCGPWTFWLPIEKDARFPRVDDVIPAVATASCTVELAEDDRQFLATNLCRLPQSADQNSPVTLELNGRLSPRWHRYASCRTSLSQAIAFLNSMKPSGSPSCPSN